MIPFVQGATPELTSIKIIESTIDRPLLIGWKSIILLVTLQCRTLTCAR